MIEVVILRLLVFRLAVLMLGEKTDIAGAHRRAPVVVLRMEAAQVVAALAGIKPEGGVVLPILRPKDIPLGDGDE